MMIAVVERNDDEIAVALVNLKDKKSETQKRMIEAYWRAWSDNSDENKRRMFSFCEREMTKDRTEATCQGWSATYDQSRYDGMEKHSPNM
jgi:hypothetical protein